MNDTLEKFSEVYWGEPDIINALDLLGLPTTEENILALYNGIDTETLSDYMVQAGWDYIYSIRDDLERREILKYEED